MNWTDSTEAVAWDRISKALSIQPEAARSEQSEEGSGGATGYQLDDRKVDGSFRGMVRADP